MTIQFSKQTPFKNWSLTEFEWKYDGVNYTFEAGQVYNVPSDIALHFALHLAKREIGDNPHNDAKMKELMNKCFPGTTAEAVSQGLNTGKFEKISTEPAKAAIEIEPTRIEKEVEPEEEKVDETKPPVFKEKPKGRPRRRTIDEEYKA